MQGIYTGLLITDTITDWGSRLLGGITLNSLKSDRLKRQKNHRLLLTFPRAVVTEKLEVAKVVGQFVEANRP